MIGSCFDGRVPASGCRRNYHARFVPFGPACMFCRTGKRIDGRHSITIHSIFVHLTVLSAVQANIGVAQHNKEHFTHVYRGYEYTSKEITRRLLFAEKNYEKHNFGNGRNVHLPFHLKWRLRSLTLSWIGPI